MISIGWDVRGWQSPKQAVAVAALEDGRLAWPGLAPAFAFPTGERLGLDTLVGPALDSEQRAVLAAARRVVVAIDSPLAFPRALRDLMHGDGDPRPPAAEIDNPLAYRECDRRVAKTYGKKPLSAAFDRLGNTASLAMAVCQGLRRGGFQVVPQDADASRKAAIEVYPGIHKQGPRRADPAIEALGRWLPSSVPPGTDLYDACICAMLGLVYAGAGDTLGLPPLTPPDPALPREEGWIFGLPAAFIAESASRPQEPATT